jgi:hypothetical protein
MPHAIIIPIAYATIISPKFTEMNHHCWHTQSSIIDFQTTYYFQMGCTDVVTIDLVVMSDLQTHIYQYSCCDVIVLLLTYYATSQQSANDVWMNVHQIVYLCF